MRHLAVIAAGIALWGGCSADGEPSATELTDALATGDADDTAASGLTYDGLIQPIYAEWCGDCHTGNEPGVCAGSTCFVTFYDDLLIKGDTCDGNKAECGFERIDASRDPNDPFKLMGLNGPIVLPDKEAEMLREWIYELGMPEK